MTKNMLDATQAFADAMRMQAEARDDLMEDCIAAHRHIDNVVEELKRSRDAQIDRINERETSDVEAIRDAAAEDRKAVTQATNDAIAQVVASKSFLQTAMDKIEPRADEQPVQDQPDEPTDNVEKIDAKKKAA